MVSRILLADIEHDQGTRTNSTLENGWSHFPIGLMYLASALRKAFSDVEVEIFHTITRSDARKDLAETLDRFAPDLVGVRSVSRFQDLFESYVQLIRSKTRCIVIAGGPFASTSFREMLESKSVDMVVIGEGEATLVDVVRALRELGTLPKDIAGTAVLSQNAVVVNERREFIQDLDAIPFPQYDLINFGDYSGVQNHAFQETRKCAYLFCSRGCPYDCIYCHQFFGKKMRRRSATNVVAEMKEIVAKHKLENFVILDDCFNVPPARAKEVLRLISQELPSVTLNFPNGLRADMIDEELILLLERCHCREIALAIEVASPRLQKVIGKRLDLEKARRSIELISQRFITTAFFMVGFPTETLDEALATIDFAKELDYVCQPVLSVVRVYDHTPLYDLLGCQNNAEFAVNRQDKMDMHTRLNSEQRFYGDYFDRKTVPLTSSDVSDLRLKWTFDVVYNEKRLRNSNKILKRHLSEDEIVQFYRCFLDRKDLTKAALCSGVMMPA